MLPDRTSRTPRIPRVWRVILVGMLYWAIAVAPAVGMHIRMSFEEVTQGADLIFVGTVERQVCRSDGPSKMVFTDVFFTDIDVIHASVRSVQQKSTTVVLTYPGGRLGQRSVHVSGTPEFWDGHRYLLCILDDGKTYIDPLVGGSQGLFEMIEDRVGVDQYPLAPGGRAIVKADASGIEATRSNVVGVQNGLAILQEVEDSLVDRFLYPEAPKPRHAGSSAAVRRKGPDNGVIRPLNMNAFQKYILDIALKKKIADRIRTQAKGKFYRSDGSIVEFEDYGPESEASILLADNKGRKLSVPMEAPALLDEASSSAVLAIGSDDRSFRVDDLYTCGYHTIPLIMEQVPASWWHHGVNSDCMEVWNSFMRVFEEKENDGYYGEWNLQNEFAGFLTDDELYETYEFHWKDGLEDRLACCVYSKWGCSTIWESDIIFNAEKAWTDDLARVIANPDIHLYRPTCMHELGHSWGYQTGLERETYAYDLPSVMSGNMPAKYEDGRGIHVVDAYLFRRQYENQTEVLPIIDVGIEAYAYDPDYGELKATRTDRTKYKPGDTIELECVTVENMSYTSVSNLTVKLYLSHDREITPDDYLVETYTYPTTAYPAERQTPLDFGGIIPLDIPTGTTYYIGASVFISETDEYPHNNTVVLPDTIEINRGDPSDRIESVTLYGTVNCRDNGEITIYENGMWLNRTAYFDSGTSSQVSIHVSRLSELSGTSTYRLVNTDGYDESKVFTSDGSYFQPSPVVSDYHAYVDDNVLGPFYIRSRDPQPPDLILSEAYPAPLPCNNKFFIGEDVEWYVTVKNNVPSGYATARGTTTNCYLGTTASDYSHPFGTRSMAELEPGETDRVYIGYTFKLPQDLGTRYMIFRADYEEEINECGPGGEENNVLVYGPFQVSEALVSPTAEFSGSPQSGHGPLTVHFTDESTGEITNWLWSFGDGRFSTDRNPSHTYCSMGDSSVSLKVTGCGGSDIETKTDYIHVDPANPDLRVNGIVNFEDYAKLIEKWLDTDCYCPDLCAGCDLDMSGDIGWPDVQTIADNWLRYTYGNLILNPSMEGDFIAQDSLGRVAEGWTAWAGYQVWGFTEWGDGHTGSGVQNIHWDGWPCLGGQGGIFQTVGALEPRAIYRLSAWFRFDIVINEPDICFLEHYCWGAIGVDPNAGTNPVSWTRSDIDEDKWAAYYTGPWVKVVTYFSPTQETATVFARSEAAACICNGIYSCCESALSWGADSYIDDVVVEPVYISQGSTVDATSPVSANGTSSSDITITVIDSLGIPMKGIQASEIVASCTGGGNIVVGPEKPTDANGQTTARVTSTVPGFKSVSVVVLGTLLSDTATIEFAPD